MVLKLTGDKLISLYQQIIIVSKIILILMMLSKLKILHIINIIKKIKKIDENK